MQKNKRRQHLQNQHEHKTWTWDQEPQFPTHEQEKLQVLFKCHHLGQPLWPTNQSSQPFYLTGPFENQWILCKLSSHYLKAVLPGELLCTAIFLLQTMKYLFSWLQMAQLIPQWEIDWEDIFCELKSEDPKSLQDLKNFQKSNKQKIKHEFIFIGSKWNTTSPVYDKEIRHFQSTQNKITRSDANLLIIAAHLQGQNKLQGQCYAHMCKSWSERINWEGTTKLGPWLDWALSNETCCLLQGFHQATKENGKS